MTTLQFYDTEDNKKRLLKNKFKDEIIDVDTNQLIELLKESWKASEQNMRSQFSSSAYKNITFEEWFSKFEKE